MNSPLDIHYQMIVQKDVEEFVGATKALGSEVMNSLGSMVKRAFEAQYVFVREGIQRKKPANDEELKRLFEPTEVVLRQIQAFQESNRNAVEYKNHMSTIAESIVALSWVTVPRSPAPFIKDMKDAGDYFGNRVLTANKGNEQHITWINKWSGVLTALEEYVRNFHRLGFLWNEVPDSTSPRPFQAVPPPPPPFPPFGGDEAANAAVESDADRQALLQEINQGVGITRILKPVKRNVAQPAAATSAQPAGPRFAQKSTAPVPSHPPVFVLEGKKWRVEYQKNSQAMQLTPNDKSESLAMFKCENSSLETKGKMNAVTIDNCKRCVIFLQHIISSVELIRCERLEIRCLGSCPNVTLDNCDCVQVFLSDSSANCEVITSKCTSINVCRMTDDGDYNEFPVPEQIRSVFVNNKLQTSVVEHCM